MSHDRFRTIPLLLLLASMGLACERSAPPLSAPQIDTLPGGVVQVRNTESGAWGPGEEWTLRETLRLGTVFGEGPDLFGRIQDMEIDVAGRLWIYEAQAEELRVFDSGGAHLRTMGRPGEGPGEFGNVYALAWASDDRLWVVDRGLGRVSVFDTAGVFIESLRRGNSFFAYPWPGGVDEDGFFYDLESSGGPEGGRYLVRFDSLLQAVDTIQLPQHPDGPQVIQVQSGPGVATYSKPFAGTVGWILTRDGGMWVAITDEYKLLRLSRSGDTLRVVTKLFEPVPVTGEEREEVLRGYRGRGVDLSVFQVPDFKPAIAGLFLDDEENIWVIPVREGDRTGHVAEVFDGSGLYLGEVELPVRLLGALPVVFRDGALATVATDTLDVPFVVRFEIGEGSG